MRVVGAAHEGTGFDMHESHVDRRGFQGAEFVRVDGGTDGGLVEVGQVADLVGGDFNSTPQSDVCEELERSLGPTVQSLGGSTPFVTWDGLSSKPGKGQTLDYVFIRSRPLLTTVHASPRAAFVAANTRDRLSDHMGIETLVSLDPPPSLANAVADVLEPLPLTPPDINSLLNASLDPGQ